MIKIKFAHACSFAGVASVMLASVSLSGSALAQNAPTGTNNTLAPRGPVDPGVRGGAAGAGGPLPGLSAPELAFFNADGTMIGAPVFRNLEAGRSTFVDLPFGGPSTNAIPPGPCRASVWVFQAGSPGSFPPNPCRATLEVLDTASGRVSVHLVPAVQHALPAVQ